MKRRLIALLLALAVISAFAVCASAVYIDGSAGGEVYTPSSSVLENIVDFITGLNIFSVFRSAVQAFFGLFVPPFINL